MVETARREAIDVLLDRRQFVLEEAEFQRFVAALSAPPAPDPKLQSLMSRRPPWEVD